MGCWASVRNMCIYLLGEQKTVSAAATPCWIPCCLDEAGQVTGPTPAADNWWSTAIFRSLRSARAMPSQPGWRHHKALAHELPCACRSSSRRSRCWACASRRAPTSCSWTTTRATPLTSAPSHSRQSTGGTPLQRTPTQRPGKGAIIVYRILQCRCTQSFVCQCEHLCGFSLLKKLA